jgi:glycerophosphoryl diester phosphodiesterase
VNVSEYPERPAHRQDTVLRAPLLLGHRGSPRTARENTLESFENAMLVGLDGVELDVQRSLDGVLVVHHDFHLPDGRLIASLRHQEIQRAELPEGGRVPTLEAVLGWAKDWGAYLNIEIKAHSWRTDGREAQVVQLVERFGLHKLVIVSSFSPVSLARVRLMTNQLETALLYDSDLEPAWLLSDGKLARVLRVQAIHPRYTLITPELVAHAHKRGWRVNTWTVNDPDVARKLLGMGVDALIGDAPSVLLSAAGRHVPILKPDAV